MFDKVYFQIIKQLVRSFRRAHLSHRQKFKLQNCSLLIDCLCLVRSAFVFSFLPRQRIVFKRRIDIRFIGFLIKYLDITGIMNILFMVSFQR